MSVLETRKLRLREINSKLPPWSGLAPKPPPVSSGGLTPTPSEVVHHVPPHSTLALSDAGRLGGSDPCWVPSPYSPISSSQQPQKWAQLLSPFPDEETWQKEAYDKSQWREKRRVGDALKPLRPRGHRRRVRQLQAQTAGGATAAVSRLPDSHGRRRWGRGHPAGLLRL